MRLNHWKKVIVLAVVAPCVTLFAQSFKAGAGKADIQTTPSMFPISEFSGQHDPVSTRVLLLDDGSQRIVILTVDTPSIQDPSIVEWKAILTKITGVKSENSLVIATHTTPAPHVLSGVTLGAAPGAAAGVQNMAPAQLANAMAYAKAVDDAVEAAATKALSTLQPAQVGFGLGSSRVNVYRYVSTAKGWAAGFDDTGFTDPSLPIVRFDSMDGKPLAWLMNYAVRPAIMERSKTADGGMLISADIVGPARRFLESQYGSGATAIFLMGADVDQAPLFMANYSVFDKEGNSSQVDIHEAGFTLVDLLGGRLGRSALKANEGIKATKTPAALRLARQSVELTTQAHPPHNAGDPAEPGGAAVKFPFVVLQIGDFAFVGMAAELDAALGVKIKTESPFANTIVVAMVEGAASPLPGETNYDRKTPAAVNSQYARGSAEKVAAAIQAQLKQFHYSK